MKIFSIFFLGFLVLASIESNASADNKLLVCSNKSGNVVIDICGIRGCPATVKLGSKVTKYTFNRVKNSDGSLSYKSRAGTRPTCNVEISTLRFGIRTAKTVSCGSKIARSTCVFTTQGAISSSSGSSNSTSAVTSSSSSSSSSSEDGEEDHSSKSTSKGSH